MKMSFRAVLGQVLTGGLLMGSQYSLAAMDVSSVPLFVKQTAQPNVMILFDDSGSMRNAVQEMKVDGGYNKADVNYYYQICTATKKNVCSTWTNVTYSNIQNAVEASNSCGTGKPIRKVTNGSSTSTGAVQCSMLPTSSITNTYSYTAGDGSSQSYTYDIEYLYYLLKTYSSGIESHFGTSTSTRINIAKSVVMGSSVSAGDGIVDTPNMRFGLTVFNNDEGGHIAAACRNRTGSDLTAFKNTINDLAPSTWTPLAETYYEITRYFRGMAPYSVYNPSGTYSDSSIFTGDAYVSPMTNYCQKNYVIVVTDGFPTYDDEFPTDDPADLADTSHALPDWDGITTQDPLGGVDCTLVKYKPFSDGYEHQTTTPSQSCNDNNGQASSLYLDDVAKFGYELDVKASSATDSKGHAYVNKDNITTFTVGFTIDNQMLKDAGETYGRGGYFSANNTNELRAALQNSINTITARTASGSAVATSSSRLDTDTTIYQALFYSEKWTGRINAFDFDEVQGKGVVSNIPKWSTNNSNFASPNARHVYTRLSGAGAQFTYANLNTAGALNGLTSEQVDWLLGDQSREVANGGDYRTREDANGTPLIMGDIVNSDPVFVGKNLDYGLDKVTIKDGSLSIGTTYRNFVNTNKENASFRSMIYVGANDGMLHAFDATTGRELFAYIPSTLISQLGKLTSPDYDHQFYVDGSPFVGHAYISARGGWRTILIGSTGYGGDGGSTIFALDVTNPDTFSASDVLWEYSSTSLGYTAATPILAPMSNDKFGVVIANGYNSSAEQTAKLIVLNAEDGSEMKIIDTGNGTTASTPNGLAQPTLIPGMYRSISTIYAGDLRGNVWKFDVSGSTLSSWDSALKSGTTRIPLFSAKASGSYMGSDSGSDTKTATAVDGAFQPITSSIAVTPNADGGYVLVFGTGKYFQAIDADGSASGGAYDKDLQAQAAYGIIDNGITTTIPYSSMQERKFVAASAGDPAGSMHIESTAFDSTKKGWYINLGSKGVVSGERVVINPVIRQGRAVFLTTIPSADPCGAGGSSRLLELMATTGAAPAVPVLDTNGDGNITTADSTASVVSISSSTNDVGLQVGLTIITAGSKEYKLTSGAGGALTSVTELSGGTNAGRSSWRQLK